MTSALPCVLTLNAGSSSIRFAVYEIGKTLRRRLGGKIDRIGLSDTHMIVDALDGKPPHRRQKWSRFSEQLG